MNTDTDDIMITMSALFSLYKNQSNKAIQHDNSIQLFVLNLHSLRVSDLLSLKQGFLSQNQ